MKFTDLTMFDVAAAVIDNEPDPMIAVEIEQLTREIAAETRWRSPDGVWHHGVDLNDPVAGPKFRAALEAHLRELS